MTNPENFVSNMHLSDVRKNRNRMTKGKNGRLIPGCAYCGQPEQHVELHSCSNPKCVKLAQGVQQWVNSVLN